MATHNELGKAGELQAQKFLAEKGYEILERNYRSHRAEIDIIAKFERWIIFAEVKTRSNTGFGFPEEAVTKSKMKLMIAAASDYMFEKKYTCECRFDVLSVYRSYSGAWHIRHFEDAFFWIEEE